MTSALADPSLKIMHYSGHGTESFLTIENDDGSTIPLDKLSLSKLLAQPELQQLSVVFLSACQSAAMASSFVEAGIPHVIAVHENTFILDDTARVS